MFCRLVDLLRHQARVRLWTPDQAAGRRGEDLAHRRLQKLGFRIVARNYRARSGAGEIDLIAWDGDTLVFVEVKSRRDEEHGAPDRAIDRDKVSSLIRAAREYSRRANVGWERVRFDVVNVILSSPPSIQHRKDALRATIPACPNYARTPSPAAG